MLVGWNKRSAVPAPRIPRPDVAWLIGGAMVLPVLGAVLGWKDRQTPSCSAVITSPARLAPLLIGCWLAMQLLVPFRHYAIEGDASWTEEAQNFSWRMMLKAKAAGHVIYSVTDAALFTTDACGRRQIDPQHWPADKPRAVYVPIDCQRFNWKHRPGLTVTYEPTLGQRIIYALSADETKAEAREKVVKKWGSLFGRAPKLCEALSVPRALRITRHALAGTPLGREWIPHLDRLLAQVAGRLHDRTAGSEIQLVEINSVLQGLLAGDPPPGVASQLRRIRPFALQGAEFPEARFLIIEDRPLEPTALQRLTGDGSYLVWVDLSRLRPDDWRQLPCWFVTFEMKQLNIVWNHFRELNFVQRNRFSAHPYLIHQYAVRIAAEWEAGHGRRPEVRVLSNVMLNFRHPQPLVDPRVDLARTPYHLFTHNRWILPLADPTAGSMGKHLAGQPTVRR